MGNAQSDADEKKAHDVIKFVPGIGQAYSGVRAATYAAKGNHREAIHSALSIAPHAYKQTGRGPIHSVRKQAERIAALVNCRTMATRRTMQATDCVWSSSFDSRTTWLVVCGPDKADPSFCCKDLGRVQTYIDGQLRARGVLRSNSHRREYQRCATLVHPTKAEFWAEVKRIGRESEYLALYYTGHGGADGLCLADGVISYNHLPSVFWRTVLSCCHSGGKMNKVDPRILIANVARVLTLPVPAASLFAAVGYDQIRRTCIDNPVTIYTAASARGTSIYSGSKGSPFDLYNTERIGWDELEEAEASSGAREVLTIRFKGLK